MKYVVKIAWRAKDGRERYRSEIVPGNIQQQKAWANDPPCVGIRLDPLSLGKGERIVQVSEAGYQ